MTYDVSFAKDKNDNIIVLEDKKYVTSIAYTLFACVPGTDPHDLERGLNLPGMTYANEDKLSGYTDKIRTQFSKYTDLLVDQVSMGLDNSVLTIKMSVVYRNKYYTLVVGLPSNELKVLINE